MNKTKSLHILYLIDDACFSDAIRKSIIQEFSMSEVQVVSSRSEYLAALETKNPDLIIFGNHVPGLDSLEALGFARQKCSGVPFLFASGHIRNVSDTKGFKVADATDCILKSTIQKLAASVRRTPLGSSDETVADEDARYTRAMERLVTVVQKLSLARDLETIMKIVRQTARELTEAEGATFILRDGDLCYYADEDAIAPLWKGRRFPMTACISGWAMLNRQQAVIEDIYADPRIPHDAYRPTFVKSLAMVPIRMIDPIGAIGTYWDKSHLASPAEVKLLQALANTTAVAMENVLLFEELEQRVRDRTAELKAANKELEAFSYAIAHDLRGPLINIGLCCKRLMKDSAGLLSEKGHQYLTHISNSTLRMDQLTKDLLSLSLTAQTPVKRQSVDLSRLAREIASELQTVAPQRSADFIIADGLIVQGDEGLLRAVMENLLANAWKYSSKCPQARIEVGAVAKSDGRTTYYVRDNGAGFDMSSASRLFSVFQRLHSENEFPGTGVGLATAQRIIHKHSGQIWAEAAVDEGATFYFTLA